MDIWIQVLIGIGAVVLAVVGVVAMRKDRPHGGGAVGNALHEFHAVFEPGVRHAVEESRKEHREEDESGDPPSDV